MIRSYESKGNKEAAKVPLPRAPPKGKITIYQERSE